jgi:hypothetical protein
MKPRSPKSAQKAVDAATNQVVQQGDIIQQDRLWDASEAALDGQPKNYLADIISGKVEGPYKPTSDWRTRSR